MRTTTTTDLKARIFALAIGFAFLTAILLGLGAKAGAAELNPRVQLDRLVDEQIDRELDAIDARIARRFEGDTSGDERTVPLSNRIILLADDWQEERWSNQDSERANP